MWPRPSEPASIPTRRKSSAMGTPVRCDARLNTTLTPSRTPQVVRRRAVAWGSFAVIGEVSPEWGAWLRPSSRSFHTHPHIGYHAAHPATDRHNQGGIMSHKENAFILFVLCAGLAACDGTSTSESTEPNDGGTLDSKGASLLALSNTWASKRPIPVARFNHQAATLNNVIYVVGGSGPNCCVPLQRVDAYDVMTNSWSARRAMPSGRFDANGASVIGNRIYVSGGRGSSLTLTKTLFVYNAGTDAWGRRADMPEVGGCGAQGVIAGKLYVYAGCGDATPGANRFYRYDPSSNSWTPLPSPPADHAYGSGEAIGGRFYLVGGESP